MGKFAKVEAMGVFAGYDQAASLNRRPRQRGIVAVDAGRKGLARHASAQALSTPVYTTWHAEDGRRQIEFLSTVLESIRFECSRSMNGVGGTGIGGVLLGHHRIEGIRVLAWRPVPCEHSRGPGFLLSEHDHATLASMLEELRADASLEAMSVVGWFVSHPRGGPELGEEELELQHRFFASTNLVLAIRTDRLGDAEFTICNGEGARIDPVFVVTPRPAARGVRPAAQQPAQEASAPRRRTATWTGALWTMVTFALFALVGGALLARTHRVQSASLFATGKTPIEMLSVHAADKGGELVITWNGIAEPIRYASRVTLLIRDGSDITSRELDGAAARAALQFYKPHSPQVTVALQLESTGGEHFEESTTYLHPSANRPHVTPLTRDMLPPPGE